MGVDGSVSKYIEASVEVDGSILKLPDVVIYLYGSLSFHLLPPISVYVHESSLENQLLIVCTTGGTKSYYV